VHWGTGIVNWSEEYVLKLFSFCILCRDICVPAGDDHSAYVNIVISQAQIFHSLGCVDNTKADYCSRRSWRLSVSLSHRRAVQKRLSGLTSCIGWKHLRSWETPVYVGFNEAFAKQLWMLVLFLSVFVSCVIVLYNLRAWWWEKFVCLHRVTNGWVESCKPSTAYIKLASTASLSFHQTTCPKYDTCTVYNNVIFSDNSTLIVVTVCISVWF